MCGSFVWGPNPGGPTNNYPYQTPPQTANIGNFSALISNLNAFTTYYYKAMLGHCVSQIDNHAVFANGAEYGEEMSFTTLGNAGAINPSTSSDVSPTGGTPPDVNTNHINVDPTTAYVNQPVTVFANVINGGDMEGGFTVNLKVDGYIEQTQMGVIAGHEAESVEFTLVKSVPGTYEIEVDGKTATLTVLAAGQDSSMSQSQFIFIAGIWLAIVLIALVVVMLMRRRTSQ
jgi:hypothetical protein